MKNSSSNMEKHLLAIKEIIKSLYKKHKLSFNTTYLEDCVSRDTVCAFNINSQWDLDMTIGEINKIRYEFNDKIRKYLKDNSIEQSVYIKTNLGNMGYTDKIEVHFKTLISFSII